MLIGNGLIAREFIGFQNNEKIMFFASGASDSKSTNQHLFSREKDLLYKTLSMYPDSTFVYFSTTSIYDNELITTPYVQHKISMESIIQSTAKHFLIFRLSQVVGNGGNKTNLINFLFEKIRNEEEFEIWQNASRNLIDINHVGKVVNEIINNQKFINRYVNIASPINTKIYEIVKEIEQITKKKAKTSIADKGYSTNIDISDILPIFQKLELDFDQDYIKNLIRKYY